MQLVLLHPLFKNALQPLLYQNPTGNIIHNFSIVTAMLNIMLLFISIIILCVCVCVCLPACYNFLCKAQLCHLNTPAEYSLEPAL